MTSLVKKAVLGTAMAATALAVATPADAQYRRYYRHRGGDDAAWAIGAGILGLGVGAAIASSSRSRYYDPYYGGYYGGYSGYDPYYGGGYGYYDPYYGNGYGYGYTYRCTTHRQWDPYWRRWVRVRTC